MKFGKNLAAATITAALTLGVTGLIKPVPVLAGGGCHSASFVDAAAEHVDLKEACFYPMVIRIPAGRSITWTNSEGMEHTVTGVTQTFGTFDTLNPGKSVTYRFETDGVYPYFCVLHSGMVGAVVVGSGNRNAAGKPGNGIVGVAPSAARVAAPRAAGGGAGWVPGFGLGALAVVLLGAAYVVRRRLTGG